MPEERPAAIGLVGVSKRFGELPDAGRIVLQGKDVTEVRANRRPVNMVFQQYALFPHMSVYDNVAFGLKVKRVPRGQHKGRIKEILRVVELEGMERRRPRWLDDVVASTSMRVTYDRARWLGLSWRPRSRSSSLVRPGAAARGTASTSRCG
jgi:ABC-type uncharacterized transport system YnjBCD ATPase subunit